mgnify:CR=1 FL=1
MQNVDLEIIIFIHYLELACGAYDNNGKYNWEAIEPYTKDMPLYFVEAVRAFVQSLDNNPRYAQ